MLSVNETQKDAKRDKTSGNALLSDN